MNLPMRPVTHRVTGREDQVVNVLNAAHARGHLLDHHSPQRHDNGQVSITITVLQPAFVPGPVSTPRDAGRVRRQLLLAVKVLAGLAGVAVLAAIGWGVWLFLEWVHAHPLLLLGGSVVAVVLAGAASATISHGRGCGHR